MKTTIIKAIAVAVILAFATPAFAGGVTVYENGDSKLKLEGKYFTSFIQETEKDATSTKKKVIGLAVDRAYFGAKYYFNKNWMARITMDVQLETGLAKRENNIFLKYAYIEGKLIGDALVLRMGQSHTPWIDYEQSLWKHRYVSKVLIDHYKFDSSSDLGIGFKGTLADGLVKYWVTGTNGKGYGAGNSKFNAIDLDSRIGIYPVKGLTLDVQYRNGYKGSKIWDAATQANTPGTKHVLTQAMISYGMKKDFRIGFNWINNKQTDQTTFNVIKDSGFGLWGWYNVTRQAGIFARFDRLKVNTTGVAIDQTTTHTVVGIEYSPFKNLSFSLAWDQDKDRDAGGVAGAIKEVTKIGLYSQFKY
jgi:hypothetical protein